MVQLICSLSDPPSEPSSSQAVGPALAVARKGMGTGWDSTEQKGPTF